jgi:TonB family protein
MKVFEHPELWSDYAEDVIPAHRRPLPVASAAHAPGAWRYRTPGRRWSGTLIGIPVAAGLHVLVIFGFNEKEVPKVTRFDDDSTIELMVMPDLSKLEEPELADISEPSDSQPVEGAYVPSLADVPTTVNISTQFVQAIDFSSLQPKTDLTQARVVTIPTTIRRGVGGTGSELKDVFNLAQLDRIPEAIFQPPPIFPVTLKKEVTNARVEVEFIVTAKGEVVEVRVVSTTHPGFENAAIAGVSRWQFRPGMKSGKRVNTRMRVPLLFRVVDE